MCFNNEETKLREELANAVAFIAARGWSPATGGNFSALLSREPLTMVISPSGVEKGELTGAAFIVVDGSGTVIRGVGEASAETLIHLSIYRCTDASAVLHTHSVANTALSLHHLPRGAMTLRGYEMLKALPGISTHETEVKIPIFENSQEMKELCVDIEKILHQDSSCRALLLSGHGLYTWGSSVYLAKRSLEAIEFLFEVERTLLMIQGNR